MPEKEPPEKVSRIFGRGRSWRSRLSRSLARKPFPYLKTEKAGKIMLLLGLSLAFAIILTPRPPNPLRHYKVGDVAREDVRAVGDFLVEDVETTGQRQQELLAQIPPVFDLDEQLGAKIQERLHQAMEFMRSQSQEASAQAQMARAKRGGKPRPAVLYKALLQQKPEFDRFLGVSLPNTTFFLLAKSEFSPYLEALMSQVLNQFFRQGVISNRTILAPEAREILVRRLPSRKESLERHPFPFLELEDVRKTAAGYCREVAGDFSPAERWLVCDVSQYLLAPNVSLNLAETQERQRASLGELRPTYFQVKRGEFIVREGDRLTLAHLAKLQAQARIYPRSRGLLIFLGLFISLALLLGLSYRLARISFKSFSNRFRDLTFLGALLFSGILLDKGLLGLGDILSRTRPEIGHNLVYLLPIGLVPIFAAIFLGLETGVGVAFLSAILASFLLEKAFPFFIYFISAGLMGVWGVRHCSRRGDLVQAGLAISLINLGMFSAFKLLEYPFVIRELLLGQALALSGGVLTGVLALGLTPFIEAGFRYTSNIRLLEVLNLDQPSLKELMLVAPGTYHHSLVVGQMVEAAAEAIGANPLVAKAAAYYHDIGKIKKPAYFVENQIGGENKHEKLAPSMSSLILIAHVKDGVELARKHHLGDRLIDIIQQHHGTCTISYFYHKAKTQGVNGQQVNIEDFRYPGPRPQTKEAGLVLLADQVEAASKTLTDPAPARIQGLVQKIINNVFADGQLDECELTLKDLHLIAKSFNKILSGIFHQRISYPLPADKKKSQDDLDKQPPKKNGHKPGEGQEKSREDLKRLGLV
jgi:putative nucleotidyltransferase with HDIG domain